LAISRACARFEPDKLEDQYETALIDLINQKWAGKPIVPEERPRHRQCRRPAGGVQRRQEAVPANAAEPAVRPKNSECPVTVRLAMFGGELRQKLIVGNASRRIQPGLRPATRLQSLPSATSASRQRTFPLT
jgi:hypothetical protein